MKGRKEKGRRWEGRKGKENFHKTFKYSLSRHLIELNLSFSFLETPGQSSKHRQLNNCYNNYYAIMDKDLA
jgi:hypothetical protein